MTFRVSDVASSFATRQAASQLAKLVGESVTVGKVIVDWTDVRIITPSFADQFISDMTGLASGFTFDEMTPSVINVFTTVMERRSNFNSKHETMRPDPEIEFVGA